MKTFLKALGGILLIVAIVVVAVFGYLTVDEYRPAYEENVEIVNLCENAVKTGTEYTFLTWNIGYGALGDNADFFLDGGKMVYSADEERVHVNLDGIASCIGEVNPDFVMLQELDRNSSRSYFTDELEYLVNSASSGLMGKQYCFAPNFKVAFVPYPVPPIGKVVAGLATVSKYEVTSAQRLALPTFFSWPVRIANLKRCLLVTRIPVDGTDKELVLINVHLEAYDAGEAKLAQTKMLKDIMTAEADKGNYVIVAGDFNQTFSCTDISKYPVLNGNWEAGIIDINDFGDDFTVLADDTYPTCRSLYKVFATAENKDPEYFQYYMLDGCIVSNNMSVNGVQTLDEKFEFSDHNPVAMKFVLKNE